MVEKGKKKKIIWINGKRKRNKEDPFSDQMTDSGKIKDGTIGFYMV